MSGAVRREGGRAGQGEMPLAWQSGQPSASIVQPSSSFALSSETLFTFTGRAAMEYDD